MLLYVVLWVWSVVGRMGGWEIKLNLGTQYREVFTTITVEESGGNQLLIQRACFLCAEQVLEMLCCVECICV